MAKAPSFQISDYAGNREAVIALLLYLRGKGKPVSEAFIAEWFGLRDHSGIGNVLKALAAEGYVVVAQVLRAGRARCVYCLRPGCDPRRPVVPSKSEMIWRVLCEARQPVTIAHIALLTGTKKETVSSYVQRLARGGLVVRAGAKNGGVSGQRYRWRVDSQYHGLPAPKVRLVGGRREAVIDG